MKLESTIKSGLAIKHQGEHGTNEKEHRQKMVTFETLMERQALKAQRPVESDNGSSTLDPDFEQPSTASIYPSEADVGHHPEPSGLMDRTIEFEVVAHEKGQDTIVPKGSGGIVVDNSPGHFSTENPYLPPSDASGVSHEDKGSIGHEHSDKTGKIRELTNLVSQHVRQLLVGVHGQVGEQQLLIALANKKLPDTRLELSQKSSGWTMQTRSKRYDTRNLIDSAVPDLVLRFEKNGLGELEVKTDLYDQ